MWKAAWNTVAGLVFANKSETKDVLSIEGTASSTKSELSPAQLTVRRTDDPHTFQLVLQREDSSEAFVLAKSLQWEKKDQYFIWSANGEEYNFSWDPSVTDTSVNTFHLSVSKCIYENAFQTDATNVSADDILTFMTPAKKPIPVIYASPYVPFSNKPTPTQQPNTTPSLATHSIVPSPSLHSASTISSPSCVPYSSPASVHSPYSVPTHASVASPYSAPTLASVHSPYSVPTHASVASPYSVPAPASAPSPYSAPTPASAPSPYSAPTHAFVASPSTLPGNAPIISSPSCVPYSSPAPAPSLTLSSPSSPEDELVDSSPDNNYSTRSPVLTPTWTTPASPTKITPASPPSPLVNTDTQSEGTQSETTTALEVQGERLYAAAASFFLFDNDDLVFEEKQTGVAIVITDVAPDKSEFKYFIYILKDERVLLEDTISSGLQANWYYTEEVGAIVWTTETEYGMIMVMCKFDSLEIMEEFKRNFIKCLWESQKQEYFPKKEEEQEWIYGSFTKRVTSVSDDESDDEKENTEFENDNDDDDDDDDKVGGGVEVESAFPRRDEERNSLLAVGRKSDRSFVIRGSKLGVFKHDSNGLKYMTTIDNIMTPSKKKFQPKSAMLHEEDKTLLLLNPSEKGTVYRMDIERGQVVEEWKTDELSVGNLLPEHRFAQRTGLQTFGVVNNGGMYIMDPRQKGPSKVVKSRTFQYGDVKNAAISCAATTKSGAVAMGTKKGEIRLFNRNVLQPRSGTSYVDYKPKATTTFPGLGDPIIGIDVTTDGEWVLATCATYLVLIPTQVGVKDGFSGRGLGKEKPSAIQLYLKPADIHKIGKVNFTPAKFNQEEGKESAIVTSTGPYVITWNLARAKKGKTDSYQMKRYDDVVVADDFEYNSDKRVVVTLPDNVVLASRTKKQ